VLKSDHRAADDSPVNPSVLEPVLFLGLGSVAVWVYLRLPRLRPQTLVGAVFHVATSFTLFALLPFALHGCRSVLPPAVWAPVFIVGLLIPALFYTLLSWLWLIARIHDLSDTPKGGHRRRVERLRVAVGQRL
jgi:hypothetical protein